eukprot:14130281-Ditylum_brightwellii.AAC.1
MIKEAMLTFEGYDREVWSSKVITAPWNVFCLIWNAMNAHLHTEMATTSSSTTELQISQGSKTMWLRSVHIAVNDFTIIHNRAPSQRTKTDFFQQWASEINSSPTNIQVSIPEDNDTDFMLVLI